MGRSPPDSSTLAYALAKQQWFSKLPNQGETFACQLEPSSHQHGRNWHKVTIRGEKHLIEHLSTWHDVTLSALIREPTLTTAVALLQRHTKRTESVYRFASQLPPRDRLEFNREIKLAIWLGSTLSSPSVINTQFIDVLIAFGFPPQDSVVRAAVLRSKVIPMVATIIRRMNFGLLKKSSSVAITSDSVTKGGYRFINLTYHCISKNDFLLRSFSGENFGVPERHTIENIADLMKLEWGRNFPNQTPFAATTDTASDMRGAFLSVISDSRRIIPFLAI
jgi:hypothetical protein